MTQKQRILRALERAGSLGITSLDFDAGRVIDDGKPIRRVAARVNELRDDGYRIISRTKNGICTYVLVPTTEVVSGPVVTTPSAAFTEVVGTVVDGQGNTVEWSPEASEDELVWV